MVNDFKTIMFARGGHTWANACVGNNGNAGYWEYASGFSKASNLMLKSVVEEGDPVDLDTFIYPICFNMRHSIELRIKYSIVALREIAFHKKNKTVFFDLDKSHDIGVIWKFFKENSVKLDGRYHSLTDELDGFLCDLSKVDSTGQVFRYPYSNEKQKHLTEISIINLINLKEGFRYIEEKFDELNNLNKYLSYEYMQGTCTSDLSRFDIKKISFELPHKSLWGLEGFNGIKECLAKKYKISKKQLSVAIDIIKNNYEFALNIGLNLGLKGLSDEQLVSFVSKWQSIYGGRVNEDGSGGVKDGMEVDRIISYLRREDDLWCYYSDRLSHDNVAGLYALFYFHRELDFSERYVFLYNEYLREFKMNSSVSKEDFMHLARKANLIEAVVESLEFLGKKNLVIQIREAVSNVNGVKQGRP